MQKVVIAPRERIDDFERTAIEFFRAVLGMDYGECIVTDESRLSDFASCGLPEDIADATQSFKALYSAWDAWVVPVILQPVWPRGYLDDDPACRSLCMLIERQGPEANSLTRRE